MALKCDENRVSVYSLESMTYGTFVEPFTRILARARNRASLFKMQEVSRHKSLDVLQDYVRDADKFDDHAGEGLLAED